MEQKTRIKGNVHYVGVNDRNKHLFEGMWPLPYGVSYNSYLIDDEMVALVDTVDICYFEVFLHKIKQVIGERPINYLIINHMEPEAITESIIEEGPTNGTTFRFLRWAMATTSAPGSATAGQPASEITPIEAPPINGFR